MQLVGEVTVDRNVILEGDKVGKEVDLIVLTSDVNACAVGAPVILYWSSRLSITIYKYLFLYLLQLLSIVVSILSKFLSTDACSYLQ